MNRYRSGSSYMQELRFLTHEEASSIRYFLTDVDDTVTDHGRLLPCDLQALYDLKESGIHTILVTGGSAGWGDLYLRQWPVDAVISESGAVSLYKENGRYMKLVHPSIDTSAYEEKKKALIDDVLSHVKNSRMSSDQFARIYDIAFDHSCEEPKLDEKTIGEIVSIVRRHGANCGVSSVHVNSWFGDYDKYSAIRYFFETVYGMGEEEMKMCSCCAGDSRGDEPMFREFPLSFAVGSIREVEDTLTYKPRYVAQNGFSDIVFNVLKKK